jgi:hypothetical protein
MRTAIRLACHMDDKAPPRLAYAESGWVRTQSTRAVDPAAVTSALAAWPELQGRSWTVLSGGLRSINVRLGEVVVRIPSEPGRIAKEAAVMRAMADRVRSPRVLAQSPRALLLEYVPHEELPATAEAGERVGEAAARIHHHRFNSSGMLDGTLTVSEPFASPYDGLRQWIGGVLEASFLPGHTSWNDRACRLWDQLSARLRREPPVLTHADFKPANVKWLPATQEVLVLDWEFAWSGPGLMDLGQMLRWGAPEPFMRGIERGYRDSGGQLADDWQRISDVLDLFNLLGLLHAEGGEARAADLIPRIAAIIGRA